MNKHNKAKEASWIWPCAIIGVLFISFTVLLACAGLKGNKDRPSSARLFEQKLKPAKFNPPVLGGLIVHPDSQTNYFDFLLDTGDKVFINTSQLEPETRELINYFFLGLTLPSEDFWVNLNQAERDKIISPRLGLTDMGRILLETDLKLKKDTACLTDPRNPVGAKYWQILKEELSKLDLINPPIPNANRVWIVPGEAVVKEQGDTVIITQSRLKVCLESDYLASYYEEDVIARTPDLIGGTKPRFHRGRQSLRKCAEKAMEQTVLPVLEYKVNHSQSYAPLRQIYNSLILAECYKRKYWGKGSFFSHCVNQCYLDGLRSKERWSKKAYFNTYVRSVNSGEYSFTRSEFDPYQLDMVQKRYFSGGLRLSKIPLKLSSSPSGNGSSYNSSNNPWMENFCQRRKTYKRDKAAIYKFLRIKHPLAKKVFSKIDILDSEEILKRADNCLATEAIQDNNFFGLGYQAFSHELQRYLTLREIFLYPTVGWLDLSQVLLTSLLNYADPERIDKMVQKGREDIVKANLESHYLIIKAMEILSQKFDLILVQTDDIDNLTNYSERLKDPEEFDESVRILLSLTGLLIPADTPQKQESLSNLLAIVERLKQKSNGWKQAFDNSENQPKLQEISNALASSPTQEQSFDPKFFLVTTYSPLTRNRNEPWKIDMDFRNVEQLQMHLMLAKAEVGTSASSPIEGIGSLLKDLYSLRDRYSEEVPKETLLSLDEKNRWQVLVCYLEEVLDANLLVNEKLKRKMDDLIEKSNGEFKYRVTTEKDIEEANEIINKVIKTLEETRFLAIKDLIKDLYEYRDGWSEEIPIGLAEGKLKVRGRYWQTIVSCIEEVLYQADTLLNKKLKTEIKGFIKKFTSNEFIDRGTTEEDIQEANELITKVIKTLEYKLASSPIIEDEEKTQKAKSSPIDAKEIEEIFTETKEVLEKIEKKYHLKRWDTPFKMTVDDNMMRDCFSEAQTFFEEINLDWREHKELFVYSAILFGNMKYHIKEIAQEASQYIINYKGLEKVVVFSDGSKPKDGSLFWIKLVHSGFLGAFDWRSGQHVSVSFLMEPVFPVLKQLISENATYAGRLLKEVPRIRGAHHNEEWGAVLINDIISYYDDISIENIGQVCAELELKRAFEILEKAWPVYDEEHIGTEKDKKTPLLQAIYKVSPEQAGKLIAKLNDSIAEPQEKGSWDEKEQTVAKSLLENLPSDIRNSSPLQDKSKTALGGIDLRKMGVKVER